MQITGLVSSPVSAEGLWRSVDHWRRSGVAQGVGMVAEWAQMVGGAVGVAQGAGMVAEWAQIAGGAQAGHQRWRDDAARWQRWWRSAD